MDSAAREMGGKAVRYAIWNNKGGVGKSFLSFVLGTEIANRDPDSRVILVDMCPQANLSEVVLGGGIEGSERLASILASTERQTVGGYLNARISSPHQRTGREAEYLLTARERNVDLPNNLYLIAGDPSLELQAQVISQIGGQTLPEDAWKNVHNWLLDLVTACANKLGASETTVIIDCNPSFSAYTELAMMASERLIVPCSSDGASARAIDNIGALLYGVGPSANETASFKRKSETFGMPLPIVHSVLLNRSTWYNQKASKAFGAMFDEIKARTHALSNTSPDHFVAGGLKFHEIPDAHSVAIVCSHLGRPLYALTPGRYEVHDTNPQVNSGPLDRYRDAIGKLVANI